MYTQLAHHYDWIGIDDFAADMLAKDRQVFKQWKLPNNAHILDLACGTGTLSLLLNQSGYQVTAIDLSNGMLEQARHKQANLKELSDIDWQQGDMRDFALQEPVDAVVCHCDSLNHLTGEDDFRKTIACIANVLKPGGGLIFDLNTLENYQTFWNGSDTDEGPNGQLITESHFNCDTHLATVHFTAREYNDQGRLLTREEEITTRYFPEEWVQQTLLDNGFIEISSTPFNPTDKPWNEGFLKTFWHCQRT